MASWGWRTDHESPNFNFGILKPQGGSQFLNFSFGGSQYQEFEKCLGGKGGYWSGGKDYMAHYDKESCFLSIVSLYRIFVKNNNDT